ncbi:hypothetical protein [Pandoraea pnomenusa]|uniref:hypothetical protein n=1 Tax=Pandoraea pnomenusa TaxID=93220 RepID=UPI0007BCACCC|nr:hypothetical protein [Pandoraea pnomenusa]ANC43588.1 hypothetical protein A6P55_04325 [Pandoraea pnomenusa]
MQALNWPPQRRGHRDAAGLPGAHEDRRRQALRGRIRPGAALAWRQGESEGRPVILRSDVRLAQARRT